LFQIRITLASEAHLAEGKILLEEQILNTEYFLVYRKGIIIIIIIIMTAANLESGNANWVPDDIGIFLTG
jgi:hypothetical protein